MRKSTLNFNVGRNFVLNLSPAVTQGSTVMVDHLTRTFYFALWNDRRV